MLHGGIFGHFGAGPQDYGDVRDRAVEAANRKGISGQGREGWKHAERQCVGRLESDLSWLVFRSKLWYSFLIISNYFDTNEIGVYDG